MVMYKQIAKMFCSKQ